MTVNIPLQSPVDLETKNIIQGDFSFTKKNSLVHQGLLSNITTSKATGQSVLYSTTGQKIETVKRVIDDQVVDTISAGDQTYDLTDPYTVQKETELDFDGKVLTVGSTTTGKVFIVSRISDKDLRLSVYDSSKTLLYVVDFTPDPDATTHNFSADIITQLHGYSAGALFVLTGSGKLVCYSLYPDGDDYMDTTALWTKEGFSGTGTVTAGFDGSVWVGVDHTDMRNRKTITFANYEDWLSGTVTGTIEGLGCVSRTNSTDDRIVVTGEPIFIGDSELDSNIKFFDCKYALKADVQNKSSHLLLSSLQIPWNKKVLDNGIIQFQKFSPTETGVTYWNFNESTDGTLGLSDSAEGTMSMSWMQALKALGEDPDSTGGSQTGQANFPDISLVNMKRVAGAHYVYAAVSSKDGYSNLRSFDAITRAFLPICSRLSHTATATEAATNGLFTVKGLQKCTQISFIDYDDPIGIWGDAISDATTELDGKQLFPHFRHFMNDTTKKGKNWDYGRGWCTFIKATLEIQKSGPFRVFERPLELWRFEGSKVTSVYGDEDLVSTSIQYLDIASGLHVGRPSSLSQGNEAMTNTYILNNYNNASDITNTSGNLIKEDHFVQRLTWQLAYNSTEKYPLPTHNSTTDFLYVAPKYYASSTNAYIFYNNEEGNSHLSHYYPMTQMLLRYHPMKSEQKESSTWIYSHHLGGIDDQAILSSIPFSIDLGENFRAELYAGEEVSISFMKTLLCTPHDMGSRYFINKVDNAYAIAFWDKGSVTWAVIEKDGDIKITKMTDYIFKTNLLGTNRNVLVESRSGIFDFQRAFIPYIMDCKIDTSNKMKNYTLPADSSSYTSNDVYYYGFGYNTNQSDERVASSFLVPAVTVSSYCNTDDLYDFNKTIINGRKGLFRADPTVSMYIDENIDEFYTHSQATTDILYKNSRYLLDYTGTIYNRYDEDLDNTSWWITSETVLYPIGILSRISGENYVTSTVDVGDNYVSRFYRNNGRTFLAFNMKDQVYFGSEIFTIQSGNYYFDGQGIYYLGSQSDYSQNIFTAYAIGMKFLANSSSEAYFYSKWDKSLYIYTASNTLQKAQSLADMGEIVDSLYSSAEQALYILFEDGKLFIRTQIDSCIIENVEGTVLQSTNIGCQVIGENKTEIYSPCLFEDIVHLDIETEWLGNGDSVSRYQFVDAIFYSDKHKPLQGKITVQALNGGKIESITHPVQIYSSEWENHLCRVRVGPNQITGSAIKIAIKSESDSFSLFSLAVTAEPISQIPSAPRNKRY